MQQPSSKFPLKQALRWIFFSTLIGIGLALLSWFYLQHLKDIRLKDDRYRIIALVQTTSQQESLKTVYLAELLDLSLDHPTNLYQFNIKEGEEKLLTSPLIKTATIKKIRPGTLYIDYALRQPIAYLGDYTNTALDNEGHVFPFTPFFTPKKLPIIYLGLEQLDQVWGISLRKDSRLELAWMVWQQLNDLPISPLILFKQIDVSKAFMESDGQRQIVLTLEENGRLYLLRLSVEHYAQDLVRYSQLRQAQLPFFEANGSKKKQHTTIIDLRIQQLAFIKDTG
jgi:cell division septal protein FtsQ